jgi:hypothetical protein
VKIEITRPDVNYPVVCVHVGLTANVDNDEIGDILAKRRIVLIGRWEPDIRSGSIKGLKAQALLNDEYKPLPKKRSTRRQ